MPKRFAITFSLLLATTLNTNAVGAGAATGIAAAGGQGLAQVWPIGANTLWAFTVGQSTISSGEQGLGLTTYLDGASEVRVSGVN